MKRRIKFLGRRREFITLLGAAAAAWPLAARAQQGPVRRVVVLVGAAETASSRGWLAAFLRRLDELGWRESRNLVTQVQWWNDQPEQMRVWAAEDPGQNAPILFSGRRLDEFGLTKVRSTQAHSGL
jgi:hypothetical protein